MGTSAKHCPNLKVLKIRLFFVLPTDILMCIYPPIMKTKGEKGWGRGEKVDLPGEKTSSAVSLSVSE